MRAWIGTFKEMLMRLLRWILGAVAAGAAVTIAQELRARRQGKTFTRDFLRTLEDDNVTIEQDMPGIVAPGVRSDYFSGTAAARAYEFEAMISESGTRRVFSFLWNAPTQSKLRPAEDLGPGVWIRGDGADLREIYQGLLKLRAKRDTSIC